MNCESVREYFSDLVDGTVDQALQIAIDNHLRTCSGCADEYEGFKHAWNLLESIPWAETPAHLHGRIMTAIRELRPLEAPVRKSALRTWWDKLTQPVPQRPVIGWSAAAMAAVVLFGIAVQVGPGAISMWLSPSVSVRQIAPTEKLKAVQVLPEVRESAGKAQTLTLGIRSPQTDVRVKVYVLENLRTPEWQPWLISSLTPASGMTLEGTADVSRSSAKQQVVSVDFPPAGQPAVNVALVKLTAGGATRYLAVYVPTHKEMAPRPYEARVQEPLASVAYSLVERHQKALMIEGSVDAMVRVPNATESTLEVLDLMARQSGLELDVLPNGIYTLTQP